MALLVVLALFIVLAILGLWLGAGGDGRAHDEPDQPGPGRLDTNRPGRQALARPATDPRSSRRSGRVSAQS